MQRLLSTLGIIIILFISIYNKSFDKIPSNIHYILFIVGALVMVIVNTLVLFLSINTIIFGKLIIRFLIAYTAITPDMGDMLLTIRWPIAFLALFIMAFLHYYIFPDVSWTEELKRKSALPGTIFFCVIWLIASGGFSIYVNTLHTYNFIYGSIAAFAMLMIWFYFTSMLMLIGGEINSQIHDKLEQDKILAILEAQKQKEKELVGTALSLLN